MQQPGEDQGRTMSARVESDTMLTAIKVTGATREDFYKKLNCI